MSDPPPDRVGPAVRLPRRGPAATLRALRLRSQAGILLDGSPRVGRGVRIEVAPGARVELGDGCAIGDGTRILARGGTVRVGAGAVLGERCVLVAHAGIAVGDGAVLGDRTTAIDFAPRLDDVERPVRLAPLDCAPVAIGPGARVGHGASVLPGATVEPEALVGAHTVIHGDGRPPA